MSEIIALVVVNIVGTSFCRAVLGRRMQAFSLISGFIFGTMLWAVEALVILILHLPFTLLTLSLLAGLNVLGLCLVIGLREGRSRLLGFLSALLGASFLFILVSLVLNHFNFSLICGDTTLMLPYARKLADDKMLDVLVLSALRTRGVSYYIFQSLAYMLGRYYLQVIGPMLGVSFFLTFFYWVKTTLDRYQLKNNSSLWIAVLSAVTFFSSVFVVQMSVGLHVNIFAAAYSFLFIILLGEGFGQHDSSLKILAMLALIAHLLTRIEASVFSAIILAVFVFRNEVSYRERLAVVFPFSIFLVGWYSYIHLMGTAGRGLIDSNTIGTFLAAPLLLLIGAFFSFLAPRRLLDLIPKLMLLLILCLCLVALAWRTKQMIDSFYAMIANLIAAGHWGRMGLLLLLAPFLVVLLPKIKGEEPFVFGIPICFLALYLMAMVTPFSWGIDFWDSTNRSYLALAPALFFLLTVKASIAFFSSRNADYEIAYNKIRPIIATALLAIVVTAFTLKGINMARMYVYCPLKNQSFSAFKLTDVAGTVSDEVVGVLKAPTVKLLGPYQPKGYYSGHPIP